MDYISFFRKSYSNPSNYCLEPVDCSSLGDICSERIGFYSRDSIKEFRKKMEKYDLDTLYKIDEEENIKQKHKEFLLKQKE